jgi:hypothetical protein
VVDVGDDGKIANSLLSFTAIHYTLFPPTPS